MPTEPNRSQRKIDNRNLKYARPTLLACTNGIISVSPDPFTEKSLRLPHSARLFGQYDAQQGTMDFEMTIVVNEPCCPKLVHEVAHPRPGCADHLGERLLSDLRHKRLG